MSLPSRLVLVSTALAALAASGCELRQRMYDQPRYEAHEVSTFFENGLSNREPIEGTIARGQLRLDDHFFQGKVNGELATTIPFTVTREILMRGQERFNIYCAPCHDRTGRGNGLVVQRGLKKTPPSLHEERLREAAVGHFFDVATNGFGAMYSYAARIPVDDRWAIASYIRALQLSQATQFEELPAEDRKHFQ